MTKLSLFSRGWFALLVSSLDTRMSNLKKFVRSIKLFSRLDFPKQEQQILVETRIREFSYHNL